MQKKIIALAVAGLVSGAAFAQSNVQIYGIVDAAYVYSKGDLLGGGTSRSLQGIQSGQWNGSRIGFKGEEALGNGLKAIFTLEYALDIDTNNGIGSSEAANAIYNNGGSGSSLAARQTFVGLASDKYGAVTVGRQYAPGFMLGRNDAWTGSTNSPWNRLSAINGATITPNSPARWNNSINYASPNMSGVSVRAIYGFGESVETATIDASTASGQAFGLGANYANGPLNLDVAYQATKSVATAAQESGKSRDEWYIGGSYDFKVVKVLGSYQSNKRKDLIEQDSSVWQIGVSAPIGANGSLMASYGQAKVDDFSTGLDDKTKSYGISYAHNLSKRTSLYTGVVVFDNGEMPSYNTTTTLGGAINTAGGVSGQLGEKNTTFMAGVLHKF